jgi:thiazole/oxazole-forming peptide maturase SagD family component
MLQFLPLDLRAGPGAVLLTRVRNDSSAALAAVASRFARVFLIRSPWAPGFFCIGAELALDHEAAAAYEMPRLSVSGNGETLEAALASCLGEAIDRLAIVERLGDICSTGSAEQRGDGLVAGWIAQVVPLSSKIDWITARDALTGRIRELPADLCLRREPGCRRIPSVGALSSGVAAGPDNTFAALRGALELCERDAAALWWFGGNPPRAFPVEHPASVFAAQLLARLRDGRTDRCTVLLDITTDLCIPSVAALSLSRQGRDLSCGMAARLDWEGAVRAAILELCQMELAAPLAEAKRAERGDPALNEIDRRHLQRAAFAASDCELIRPQGFAVFETPYRGTGASLQDIATQLDRKGIRFSTVDLTRPDIGMPVARVVAAELQPYTSDVVTPRLERCRAANKSRGLPTAPTPLM